MSEYTDCPLCKGLIHNEERGHIATFDHIFFKTFINTLLDLRDDIHVAIDVSKPSDPWETPCYHITWRKNLSIVENGNNND